MIGSPATDRQDADRWRVPSLSVQSASRTHLDRSWGRERSIALLRRCFSEQEWRWLEDEVEYQKGLEEIEGITDAEAMIHLGLRLIDQARKGTLPSGRRPPSRVWR